VRAERFRQVVPRTTRRGASFPRISAALRLRSTRRRRGQTSARSNANSFTRQRRQSGSIASAATPETKGRPQHPLADSHKSGKARQADRNAAGVRENLAADSARAGGNTTDVSASSALFEITDALLTETVRGNASLHQSAREERQMRGRVLRGPRAGPFPSFPGRRCSSGSTARPQDASAAAPRDTICILRTRSPACA